MNILEKNLEFLKEQFGVDYIFDDISKDIIIEKAQNNEDTMKIIRNDKENYVHSTYYPKEMGKIFVDNFLKETDLRMTKVIILYGLGLGYELNYLKEKLEELDKKIHILVLEPNKSIFDLYIKTNSIFPVSDENITVKFIVDEKNLEKGSYAGYIHGGFENMHILKLQSYAEIYKENYLEILKLIQESVMGGVLSRNTLLRFTNDWSKLKIKNMKYNFETPNVEEIKKLINGKPTIVVAAGPSLNNNIQILKNAKNKFFIICVYTAYRPLQKAGIEPDLILSVDSNQQLYDEHQEGYDVPAGFSVFANTELIERNKNNFNNIFIFENDYAKEYFPENLFDKVPIMTSYSGTVASVALNIATEWGANPVILVGQDLGYPEGDKTHVDGSYFDKNLTLKNEKARNFIEKGDGYASNQGVGKRIVKGNYTENFVTDSVLYSYLLWFKAYIPKMSNEKGITYINATEGGAFIDGTEIMTLKEAIEKYECEKGISEKFREVLKTQPLFKSYEDKRNYYDFICSLYNSLCEISEITEKAKEASVELDKLYKHTNFPKQSSLNKIVKILDEEDAKLRKRKEKFFLLEEAFFQVNYFLENFRVDDTLNEKQKILAVDVVFHRELDKLVQELKENFENLLKEINEKYAFDKMNEGE